MAIRPTSPLYAPPGSPSCERCSGEQAERSRSAWIAAGVVVLLLIGLFAVSLVREDTSRSPALGVTLDQIVAQPEEFDGTRLTLAGEVARRSGGGRLVIGGPQFGLPGVPVELKDRALLRGVENFEAVRPDDLVHLTGEVDVRDGTPMLKADTLVVQRRRAA